MLVLELGVLVLELLEFPLQNAVLLRFLDHVLHKLLVFHLQLPDVLDIALVVVVGVVERVVGGRVADDQATDLGSSSLEIREAVVAGLAQVATVVVGQ